MRRKYKLFTEKLWGNVRLTFEKLWKSSENGFRKILKKWSEMGEVNKLWGNS